MIHRSLEGKLQAAGSAVTMLRSSQLGPLSMYGVPSEFSNWRDEQIAWRETTAFFDLTHHMCDLSVEGPDALRLFSDLGVNSFANFQVNMAKQFICTNADGYMIGDAILLFLDKNRLSLVGQPIVHNWVQYHAQAGRYDVTLDRDEPTAINPTGKRKLYRFQVQGPSALKVLSKASGGSLPEIKFFHLGEFTIAGRRVRALRHGMAGVPGLEFFGPWEEMDQIRASILEAGAEFGLRQAGQKAFLSTAVESGWIPVPLPAIYTDDALKAYRAWLPANSYEATCSLGGSFYSEQVADYYVTPAALGYQPFVKFDHDFVGRTALEAMPKGQLRRKVTLLWNTDDVLSAMRTRFEKGDPAKYIDWPVSNYAIWHYDKVVMNGRYIGLSRYTGYTGNERAMLSLAMVDADVPIGGEVTVIWGEQGGGSMRPVVERHRQIEIRAVVSPCPYSEVTRTSYKG